MSCTKVKTIFKQCFLKISSKKESFENVTAYVRYVKSHLLIFQVTILALLYTGRICFFTLK